MDFSFTEEEEQLRKEVHDFLLNRLPSDYGGGEVQAQTNEQKAFGVQMQKELGEEGWLSYHWPIEYGGMGKSQILGAIIAEELGYWGGLTPNGTGLHLGASTLIYIGTEEQKKKHLLSISRGDNIQWIQVFTEPDAGTDEANVGLRAVQDGDYFIFNGSKIYVGSSGYRPQLLYTLARTAITVPKHRGISLFLIPADLPGISYRGSTYMGGEPKLEIFFTDARVHKDCLLGQLNRGFYHAMTTFEFERTGTGGPARVRRELDVFLQYCKETKRNGKPLWEDADIRDKLAKMAVEAEVMRQATWVTVWRFQNRERVTGRGEYDITGLLARLTAPEHCKVMTDIIGLYGLVEGGSKWALLQGSLATRWRGTRSQHGGGTTEIRKVVLAERGLGLPRIPGKLRPIIGQAIKEERGQ